MDQFVEGKNPYTILGLETGKNSTIDEIKKAYRRLALIKHPDKAKTPNAAQEFDELKKAYAILSDKSARAALDEYLEAQAAREVRLSKQDAKRQRLREELERKEREGAKSKNEEEQARAKLKVELEALRVRAQQEQLQRQEAAAAAAAARAASSAGASASGRSAAAAAAAADGDDETTQLLLRTVKASWDPSIGNYTTDRLRAIFSAGWTVEDVILKDSHKKKKASALVVLSSMEAAQQAAQEVHGDLKNPLLVTPYLKVMPAAAAAEQQQQQGTAAAGRCSTPPSTTSAEGQTSKQPLFASGLAGATSRPVQRPSKPLFPGAVQRQQQADSPKEAPAAASSFSSFPGMPAGPQAAQPTAAGSTFSSFPGMPGTSTGASGAAAGSQFSSFPGMPASAAPSAAGSSFSSFPGFPRAPAGGKAVGVPVGGGFEDAVLGKLQQKKKVASPGKEQ